MPKLTTTMIILLSAITTSSAAQDVPPSYTSAALNAMLAKMQVDLINEQARSAFLADQIMELTKKLNQKSEEAKQLSSTAETPK